MIFIILPVFMLLCSYTYVLLHGPIHQQCSWSWAGTSHWAEVSTMAEHVHLQTIKRKYKYYNTTIAYHYDHISKW